MTDARIRSGVLSRQLRTSVHCVKHTNYTWRQNGISVLIGILLIAAHMQAYAQPITLSDYRNYLPDNHPVPRALRQLEDSINQASILKHPVRVISNPLKGSPDQQIQAIQNGVEEAPGIALVAASGLADLVPSFSLFDAPFSIQTPSQAEEFYSSANAGKMLEQLHEVGLHGLAWMENGWRVITANRPMRDINSFENLRIRIVQTPLSEKTFQAFRAQAISLPANKVLNELREGKLPAQEGFISQLLLQESLSQFHSHLWLTKHSYGAQVLLMNLDRWKNLSPVEQKLLQLRAQSISANQRNEMRHFDEQALHILAAQGIQIQIPSSTLTEAMKDATKNLRDFSELPP